MSSPQKTPSIGQYQIVRQIGAGGMSRVFLAQDQQFARQVVIKLLARQTAQNPEAAKRFLREARAIARLEHSAIVPVYGMGDYKGRPYLVMRYMSQGSLANRLAEVKGRPLPLTDAYPIIERISSALLAAQRHSIIHRDIKPDNILFDGFGQSYLADFGIAKIASATQGLTRAGHMVGTPAYMSPEQVLCQSGIDHRADVYSLTVMLFEMVTGRLPYIHQSDHALAQMQIEEPIPRASRFNAQLPQDLDKLLAAGMAKDPAQRLANSKILAEHLEKIVLQSKPRWFTYPTDAYRKTRQNTPALTRQGVRPASTRAPAWLWVGVILLLLLFLLLLIGLAWS